MRNLLILLISIFFLNGMAFSQINLNKVVDRSVKKAERNVERRVERRIDKGVDNVLDKTEEGIDETVKGDGKDKKNDDKKSDDKNKGSKSDSKTEESTTNDKGAPAKDEVPAPQEPEKPKPVLEWAKYDFVPGTEIIFEDNQEGEQNGEFPSKWDLVRGNVENANFDGGNVIYFIKVNSNGGGGIVPLIRNNSQDYLPDEFTIEFDAYFTDHHFTYFLFFADYKNQKNIFRSGTEPATWSAEKYLRFKQNGADGKNIDSKTMPGTNSSTNNPGWRHIAVSFNKRAIKAYIDDTRILNIPNVSFNPTGIGLSSQNSDGKKAGYIKNIRIAKGAVPLYDKVLTDGKFVTTGIKFDVNKATIKAESIGTINYVVKMMQDNPTLRFSVEGHTDSDGEDASNLKLSEARAKAVMDKLVESGIAKDRLTSKGHGESKPMAANDSPEGKAQNRRVEFVKF